MTEIPNKPAGESPLRTFTIDGKATTGTTYRTRIIESIIPVAGHSFLDVGANDGVEAQLWRCAMHRVRWRWKASPAAGSGR